MALSGGRCPHAYARQEPEERKEQVKITVDGKTGSRLSCGHFAIADRQHAWLLLLAAHAGDHGQRARITGSLSRHYFHS
jgi:hypothetical protein